MIKVWRRSEISIVETLEFDYATVIFDGRCDDRTKTKLSEPDENPFAKKSSLIFIILYTIKFANNRIISLHVAITPKILNKKKTTSE